ncbi:hypothetical protein SISNIDRAFT_467761 [Sistotremastrum niveocremeum HHB9708]|uniref:DUF6593 domain-containing protein n=1 Tax=Sistotremastrum niveocremeum HHB9708 TaxID=1314777 RepID=A0A164SIQ4_9AGAM|nr:hypothetical protein SISNIDRAFT_467761 [Sistotremastrum niveocremeum HHB9708]
MSTAYTPKDGEVALTFLEDSPAQTEILSSAYSDTEPFYFVKSENQKTIDWHKATVILKASSEAGVDPQLLVTIQYRGIRGDRIALDTEEKTSPVRVEDYLNGKHAKLVHYEEFAFEDEQGNQYQWHRVDKHAPKLFMAGELDEPIAELHSRGLNPKHIDHYLERSVLVLSPKAVAIQDRVLISFLWILNKTEGWLAWDFVN